VLDRVIRVLELPARAAGIVAAWLLVPLVLVTCFEIVMRYAFGAPTIWGFEFASNLTGANWLLGIAFALAIGAHVRTDVLSQRFPKRVAAGIDLAGFLFLALPMLAWLSHRLLYHFSAGLASGERTGASAWNPPVWPMRLVIFFGITLLTLQVVVEILKRGRIVFGRTRA
jgi:TRAP-type mannitol/chloroaromatic compound transport system permease small subunit